MARDAVFFTPMEIMNLNRFALPLLGFLLALGLSTQAQLVTDNTVTPEQALVDFLLGEGVEVSNITFSGDLNQIGSFDASATNIEIPDGIMLATGDIDVAIGPNNAGGAGLGGGNFGAGDDDLTALSTFNTNDAAILEFDFVPSGDSLIFNYIFGSEEYNEYVCGSVNDAFGFFLSGPGITGPYSDNAVNLAVIPNPVLAGEFIPVTINSVNLGVPGNAGGAANCNQVSEQWNLNTDYYVDNEGNSDPTSVQLDGFTVVLTAAAQVQCGQTYHIKIAIADAGDTAWDSAVFLEGGSFASNGANIEASASIGGAPVFLGDTVVVEGCNEAAFTVIRPVADLTDTLELTIYGTAESGVDFVPIDTAIIMEAGVNEQQVLLEVIDDNIAEGPETVTLEYLYVNLCGDSTLASATLVIQDPDPLLVQVPEEVALCPPVEISALVTQGYAPFTFDWSTGDTTATIDYTDLEPTTIDLTVTDVCGDSIVLPIDLVDPTPLEVQIVQQSEPYCPGDPVVLGTEVLSGSGTVTWSWSGNVDNSNGGNANVSPSTNETFTVNAEDACGQEDEANWTVLVPTYEPIVSEDVTFCLNQSGVLGVEGGTFLYTFAGLDGTSFMQDAGADTSVTFTNGTGSMYVWGGNSTTTVVITDECGTSLNVDVTSEACETIIPNIFTPNNDGENDRFEIDGIVGYPGSSLQVFNRWGSEVFFDPSYDSTWEADGLPDGTYYYIFNRSDGVSFAGHVQLVRQRF